MGLGKTEKVKPVLAKYVRPDLLDKATEEVIEAFLPTYVYRVDDLNISALKKIWEEAVKQGDYVVKVSHNSMPHLTDGERHRVTQLRFHGLLAKAKNEHGKQRPNMWILTRRAAEFLNNKKGIPSKIKVRDNKVIATWPEMVTMKDFRVLDDFSATYEIIDGEFVRPVDQLKLL